MLRNELLIRKQMCKRDQRENPSLYKVNCMTVTQIKINLGILLSGYHEKDIDNVIQFPDESTMLSVLDDIVDGVNEENMVEESVFEDDIQLKEPCAVIWDSSIKREWFLGMTREKIKRMNTSFISLNHTQTTVVKSIGNILITQMNNQQKLFRLFHVL